MSATATVSNPAPAGGPAGPASAKAGAAGPGHTGAAHAAGALGAFDAIMAAFFASMDGTAQPGGPAVASMAGTPVVADSAKAAGDKAAGDKDALAVGGENDADTAKTTPDGAMTLALLGLGAPPAPTTSQPTSSPSGEAAAGGANAGAGGQSQALPPQPAETLPNPASLLGAEAAFQPQGPGGEPVIDADPRTPATGSGLASKGGDAAPELGADRATPKPPGLDRMSASGLEQARTAPAADPSPTAAATLAQSEPAELPTSPQAAAPLIQPTANTPPPALPKADLRPGRKAEEASEKAPRAARAEAVAPGAGGRVGGADPLAAAKVAAAPGPDAGKDKTAVEGAPTEAAAPTVEAEMLTQDAAPAGQASAAPVLPTRETPAHAPAAPQVRGSPETVANLSAHLIKKLDERATRFDLQLDPVGLGRVDVRLEINARGQVSAAMSFDNPQAAAELKARSAELQQALEQAGFDISGGMSFDVADQSNGGAQQQREFGSDTGAAFRGRAFQAALDTAGEAATAAAASALYYRQAPATGVDVRI